MRSSSTIKCSIAVIRAMNSLNSRAWLFGQLIATQSFMLHAKQSSGPTRRVINKNGCPVSVGPYSHLLLAAEYKVSEKRHVSFPICYLFLHMKCPNLQNFACDIFTDGERQAQ